MTGRRRLGLVAASATLLAAAPLSAIFESWNWLLQSLLTVVLIAGAAVAARTLRFPTWAQTLCMVVALVLALTWIFPSGKEILIPQPATFGWFVDLIKQAGEDTRAYGVPVPDREGLQFVAVLGIGTVAIVVDLLTAVFRRPALAGLPMLAIYSIPVAVYLDSVPVVPFIIGAAGYMWLLAADNVDRVRRFGRRFTGDGRDVDVWEPSPLAAAGRRIGVVGVLVAVLLPLAVPTVSGGLLSRLTQSGSGVGTGPGTGGSGRINLFAALSGALNPSTPTADIIKVTTDEPEPFYLRFAVADVLNNEGFGNQSPKGQPVSQGLPDPARLPSSDQASYTEYHARLEVTDALRQGMLPVFSHATGVQDLKGGWAYDAGQQVFFSQRSTTAGQNYQVTYQRPRYTAAQLQSAEPLSRDDPPVRQFTATPGEETVQARVDELIAGETNEYDKVMAIYKSFSSKYGFRYNVSTQSNGNASEIAAFLENKVGYCQQYAAAMAWMVRAAGIPARVAFGFTRGTELSRGVYQITNKNAHAWTEVYLDGFGWVPFDATPSTGVPGAARPAWAPDVESSAPAATSSAGTTVPESDSSVAPNRPERPEQANDGSTSAIDEGVVPDDGSWTGLLVAAGVALVIALLLVPALRRALLRRRRHAATAGPAVVSATGPDPTGAVSDLTVTSDTAQARADAHAAWDELIDTMVDFRVPVDPTETPRHTAQRLIKDTVLDGDAAKAAQLLGTAEERARYARRPMQGAELTDALGQVRSGLVQSATFRTRMRAMLLPPSVLLDWRLSIADRTASVAESLTRLRDAAVRFSPRRLLTRPR